MFRKNKEYILDKANIIYNGSWIPASYWDKASIAPGSYLAPYQGKVELVDNDNDDKYEVIFVTAYETKVVDSVYSGNKKIGMKVGTTIDLTPFIEEKDGYTYSITLDGKKIDITDIKEYDVLSVAASRAGRNIDIIVSRNVVEGIVSAIDPHSNPLKAVYTIGKKNYTISSIASAADYPAISSKTEGIFHLDIFGKIAMISSYPLTRENIAYIVAISEYESIGKTECEIKLFNKDGSIKIYELADRIMLNHNYDSYYTTEYDLMYILSNNITTLGAQLITYKTNTTGEISALSIPTENISEGLNYTTITESYSKDLYGFNTASIKEDALVFYAPPSLSDNEYEIVPTSIFEDGKDYNVSLYDINPDLYSSVVVIHSEIPVESPDSIATVVSSEVTDNTIKLTFIQDGEEKTLLLSDRCNYNLPGNNPFTKGSTFRYTLNHNGLISDIYDVTFIYNSITDTSLGFIESVGDYQSMGESVYEVKLFNRYGEHVTYKLSNRLPVKVNGAHKKIVSGVLTDETGISYASDVAYYLSNLIYSGNYADRLISYFVNAHGYITSIDLSVAGTGEGMQYKAFEEEYPFGSANINDNAIIFYLPEAGEETDYEIAPVSAFKDGEKYSVFAYNINSDLCSDLLIVTTTIINEAPSSIATVTKSEFTNESIGITFTQDSEEKTLMLAKDCAYNIPDNNLFTPGTTFRYSLNLKGEIKEIFDENFVVTPITDTKIAFIKAIGNYQHMGEVCYEVELLNKDGSICIYNLADKISVKNNTTTLGKKRNSEVFEMIDTLLHKDENATNYAGRIISYIANTKGEIISITFPDNNTGKGLSIAEGSTTDKYDETSSSLKYGITDESIIFYLPVSDSKDKILDISDLHDGYTYNTAYLDIDGNNKAGIMIITEITSTLGGDTLAVVTSSTTTKDADGYDVIEVSFLQNGEEKTLQVEESSYMNDIYYNCFNRGSVFEYTLNFDGEMAEAKFCGLSQMDTLTWQEVKNFTSSIPTKKTGNMVFEYIGGYVVNKNGSILTLSTDFTATSGDRVAIPTTANIYTMDVTKAKVVPKVSSIGDILKCQWYTAGNYAYTEQNCDTYVLIKYINDKIVDVIAYNGFEPSTQI